MREGSKVPLSLEKNLAAILYSPGEIKIEYIDKPKLTPSDVLVKVEAVGICGSDLVRYRTGKHVHVLPLIMGHEISGVVSEMGSRVKNVDIGDRVTVFPIISCKRCLYCRRGKHNLCLSPSFIGSRMPMNGGFSRYVKAPAENLLKIPDSISFQEAAMTEPLSVAVHVTRIGRIEPHQIILILGAGTIGLLILQVVKTVKPSAAIVADLYEHKLKLASELGADETISSKEPGLETKMRALTENQGPDVVFEAAGSQATIVQSLRTVRKSGRIVSVGLPDKPIKIDADDWNRIVRGELCVQGSYNYDLEDFRSALSLLREKKVDVSTLITHRFRLRRIRKAFETMEKKRRSVIKVMLFPD